MKVQPGLDEDLPSFVQGRHCLGPILLGNSKDRNDFELFINDEKVDVVRNGGACG